MRDRLSPAAWLLILLAVVCLPRITIDIYLPSLPVIGQALQLSEFQLSLTMTVYMAGYAVSMLVCGPLADRYGRRPVLIGGTALYLVATIACGLAWPECGMCATSLPLLAFTYLSRKFRQVSFSKLKSHTPSPSPNGEGLGVYLFFIGLLPQQLATS